VCAALQPCVPKPNKAVGEARGIKAELLVNIGNSQRTFGPLAWTETISNIVNIEILISVCGMRLFVLGRISGLPDNVVVDLFGRLGLRWLGWGYNRRWRPFRLLRCRHRKS
jgi:hypothetical protein